MIDPDGVQLVVGVLSAAGIFGVWFRLGTLTAKTEGLEGRTSALSRRIEKLEDKIC